MILELLILSVHPMLDNNELNKSSINSEFIKNDPLLTKSDLKNMNEPINSSNGDELNNYVLSSASSLAGFNNDIDKDEYLMVPSINFPPTYSHSTHRLDEKSEDHYNNDNEEDNKYCTIIYPQSYYIYHNRNNNFGYAPNILQNRTSETDLEAAFDSKKPVILIYDKPLGDYTARWITFGNFIHKMAVISGLSSLIIQPFLLKKIYPRLKNKILSTSIPILMSQINIDSKDKVYTLFWSWDPCCKYQILRSLDNVSIPVKQAIIHHFMDSYFGDSDFVVGKGIYNQGHTGDTHNIMNKDPLKFIYSKNFDQNIKSQVNIAKSGQEEDFRPVVLIYKDDIRRKYLHCALNLFKNIG
ncbi:unnamed protein product [Gordionus sp. m RMFG-2023]